MLLQFDNYELDTVKRELRRHGELRVLQPKAFEVLQYLILHRDRVVPKDELLEKLWPAIVVTDASIQRAVSLARAAICDNGQYIRTMARQGYRFIAPVREERQPLAASAFRPRFVNSGGVHIAYHVLGEGESDIVVIPGWVFPMRAFFDHPQLQQWLDRLAQKSRVVLFDKRGTGLSDRVKELPTLQQRVDDLRLVLDAVGSRSAVLIGISEGGPLSVLYAASFPERVRGLMIIGSFARWSTAPDYPFGWPSEAFDRLRAYIASEWGGGETIRAIVASRADDPEIRAWAAQAEQHGASPGAALDLLEMNLKVDVRAVLPTITVPTAVVHGRRDSVSSIENARYLAARIPNARSIEIDSMDHALLFEGAGAVFSTLAWLLQQPQPVRTHFLATVVALETDCAASPAALRELAAAYGGEPIQDALAWSFDGPQRAIRCAHALIASLAGQDDTGRAGVHTGELTRTDAALAGAALDAARAVARVTRAGEVRVSRVVRDLVHGSHFTFSPGDPVALADGRRLETLVSRAPAEISER